MERQLLRPRDIMYGHTSIANTFQPFWLYADQAEPCVYSLFDTVLQCVEDPELAGRLPQISVVHRYGRLWCADGNRRLFVYQMLEALGLLETVAARVTRRDVPGVPTQGADGWTIVVRGVPTDDVYRWKHRLHAQLLHEADAGMDCEPLGLRDYMMTGLTDSMTTDLTVTVPTSLTVTVQAHGGNTRDVASSYVCDKAPWFVDTESEEGDECGLVDYTCDIDYTVIV